VSDALLEQAAANRIELERQQREDRALNLLLARYEKVTANPRSMGYLRFLLKHYGKSSHPWGDCYRDNFRRFGPKTKGLCGVLKDTIRQDTHWRHGSPRGLHPGHPDVGTPGVAIAEADKGAANPPWGPWMHNMKLEDVTSEYADVAKEVWAALLDVAEQCDPCRVMLGLDPTPDPSTTYLERENGQG
jgi:hypothetical protein